MPALPTALVRLHSSSGANVAGSIPGRRVVLSNCCRNSASLHREVVIIQMCKQLKRRCSIRPPIRFHNSPKNLQMMLAATTTIKSGNRRICKMALRFDDILPIGTSHPRSACSAHELYTRSAANVRHGNPWCTRSPNKPHPRQISLGGISE